VAITYTRSIDIKYGLEPLTKCTLSVSTNGLPDYQNATVQITNGNEELYANITGTDTAQFDLWEDGRSWNVSVLPINGWNAFVEPRVIAAERDQVNATVLFLSNSTQGIESELDD
jgi:hypothetical protein